jgi:hypothetical protein
MKTRAIQKQLRAKEAASNAGADVRACCPNPGTRKARLSANGNRIQRRRRLEIWTLLRLWRVAARDLGNTP